MHIRFDSDSDEEPPPPPTQPITEVNKPSESLPHVNGSNSSVRIVYVPTSELTESVSNSSPTNGVQKPPASKSKKKTIDLLFEMKQHKTPEEKEGKKIQQQFGRKRAQHKKRALDYFSMANFVDQAFGLEKKDLEQQFSSNGNHTPSSAPQVHLPMYFPAEHTKHFSSRLFQVHSINWHDYHLSLKLLTIAIRFTIFILLLRNVLLFKHALPFNHWN